MLSGKSFIILTLIVVFIAYWYNPLSKSQAKKPSPVVDTKYGKLRGLVSTSRKGNEFYEFLGIPYASPPIGEKRFEPPTAPKPWEGIKEANVYGNKCMHLEMIGGGLTGDEDCLFLNVYSNNIEKIKQDKGALHPVMIFIHGGAFVSGSANEYGPRYFMDEEIVLVTINYRLAALGFLNTGSDGVIRGNMGLKDQVRAMMWVKGNIQAFGGDPNRITIFGESAGSASVHLHILSPLTKGLFHRSIAQSGTSLSSWAVYRKPKEQAQRYAAKFNCPTEDSKEMVACLKKIDAPTFVKAHYEELKLPRDPEKLFGPTIEYFKDSNSFLTDDPIDILESGKFHKVPMISGVNSEEGLITSAIFTRNQTKMNLANSDWTSFLSGALNIEKNEEVAKKIRQFYFSDAQNIGSAEYLQTYTNMVSDRAFFWGIHKHALIYAKYAPIRLYYYTHQGDFSLAPFLASTQGPFPILVNVILDMSVRWFKSYFFNITPPHMGVCHADEIALLFNMMQLTDSMTIQPGDKEYDISTKMVKLWANFATDDNSQPLVFKDLQWPVVSLHHPPLKYLRIDNDAAVIEEPFTERVKFWDSLKIKLN